MAKSTKTIPQPPFAWLGRYWTAAGLTLVLGTAAFFRFYQLAGLPPGLDEASARVGLQALSFKSAILPGLNASNGYSPLWVWLQSVSVHLLGHTALSLRVFSALIGTLAVAAIWLWLRDWFNPRIAWVGALAVAVSPWAVSVSRGGLESALPPLLIPLALWLALRALKAPSTRSYAALGLALALNLFSGPIGWLFTVAFLGVAALKLLQDKKLSVFTRPRYVGAAIFTAALAIMAYLFATSLDGLRNLPQALSLVTAPGTLFGNLVKTLLMFNVHGDENYRHNLAGEPMLNAFLGLMLIAGLLVSIARMHQRRYRAMLIIGIVMLIPPVITGVGVPNSSWAVGLLPFVMALAAIGTSYMLELWYATFPINSAARATGQAAIILLLALSLLQGYTQYFRAWAGSTAVYDAYNEGSVKIAQLLANDKFKGERIVVVPAAQAPVINYLDFKTGNYRIVQPADLTALPLASAGRQFYITAASKDEAVKTLKSKFPGGVLRPIYSDFNLVEIVYLYEVNK
jgi:4-amino-4-deoxy-L-arabinose transferase-like glycosyltransferase